MQPACRPMRVVESGSGWHGDHTTVSQGSLQPEAEERYSITCAGNLCSVDMRLPICLSNDQHSELTEALNTVAERLNRLIELAEETNELLRPTTSTDRVPGAQAPLGAGDSQAQPARRQRGRPRRERAIAEQQRRRSPRSAVAPRNPGL